MFLSEPVTVLKGIGEKRKERLRQAGITTIYNIINYFPRTYIIYENALSVDQVEIGTKAVLKGKVNKVNEKRINKNLKLLSITITCYSSKRQIEVSKFVSKFQKYSIVEGHDYFFYGTIKSFKGNITITADEIVSTNIKNKIKPIYSFIGKGKLQLGQNFWEKIINEALKYSHELLKHQEGIYSLFYQYTKMNNLMSLNNAYYNIHCPEDSDKLNCAIQTLKYWEVFKARIEVLNDKNKSSLKYNKESIKYVNQMGDYVTQSITNLPFELRDDQTKALKEIIKDFQSDHQMYRLLQGDVGSGKTVVAMLAMVHAYDWGWQSAMMVPTEMLATQHFKTIKSLLAELPIHIFLLTGSSTKNYREQVLERISTNKPMILIGTQALMQDTLEFNNLGLVVIDEQHKFGVTQREKLQNKQKQVHTLYMSATPIPRTLAFALYRHLDVSTLKKENRQDRVDSYYVPEYKKYDLYNYLKKELRKDNQAYVICPTIINDNAECILDLASVNNVKKELEQEFKDFKVEAIHGKLKENEKQSVMGSFSKGVVDILVATSVVEVGIDNPNANILIVKNCERFGLSQLHQFRGRIGRGENKAQCFLMGNLTSNTAKKRTEYFLKTNDGFKLSQIDFKLRGPGELTGLKQHGMSEFKLIDPIEDKNIFKEIFNFIEKERL